MIKIKQQGDSFRLEIQNEEWKFGSREEMEKALKQLLDLKDAHGKLLDK